MKQQRLKTEINGHEYTFVGQGSAIKMKTTARLLKRQLAQLKQLSSGISDQDAAILLAYNAISNQFDLKSQLDRLKARLSK